MKNKYEIRGDVTAIFVSHKGIIQETLIDTDKLETVSKFNGTWYLTKPHGENGYLRITNGRNNKVFLHRLVVDAPKGMQVDHINHNTLDNRVSNLRIVTIQQNLQNKLRVGSNNTSGVRGVSWNKKLSKWRARIHVNNKEVNIGFFDSLDEASEAVRKAKAKHVPDSYESVFLELNVKEDILRSKSDSTSRNVYSPYKNIRLDSSTNKWLVDFTVNRKRYYVGLYDDIETAKEKLLEAKKAINKN